MTRALVVAAHPDDETLGCGGTVAKHTARGDEVFVLFLAEGISARFRAEDIATPEVTKLSERRNRNAVRALAILGVPEAAITLSKKPCCRLDQIPQIEIVKEIERALNEIAPAIVYTHAAQDVNVDHRIAHQSVLAACRPSAAQPPQYIFAFEVLSSTEWNPVYPFAGTAFQDITNHIDAKVAALAAYEDEMNEIPHPRSEAAVRALATFRGVQSGVLFAEAFQLIRSLNW
jgi:LmbE family N-acetylglucosaminyl deacetylase